MLPDSHLSNSPQTLRASFSLFAIAPSNRSKTASRLSRLLAHTLSIISSLAGMDTIRPPMVMAEITLPSECRQDTCWQDRLAEKKLLKTNGIGSLYELKVQTRSCEYRDKCNSFGEASISWVFCSKTRPAYIFRPSETRLKPYIAHLLSPDGESWFGYNRDSLIIYWAACHNLAGPDYFGPQMVSRAIALGYRYGMNTEQIEINHPLEIME